jgi:DNA-binding NtrC family response regulator
LDLFCQKNSFVRRTLLSEELLESELFRPGKGSFYRSPSAQRGKLELAQGGTVFFEKSVMSLRSFKLNSYGFCKSGSLSESAEPRGIRVALRIIAATNQDFDNAVKQGRFRQDLYAKTLGLHDKSLIKLLRALQIQLTNSDVAMERPPSW